MRRARAFGAAALASAALAGCVSTTTNLQSPTATEQLLTAHAAERAAAAADLHLARGARAVVEVDAGDDTPGGKYAAAAFKAHLQGRGIVLVDRDQATTVITLRIAAAGIDDLDRVVGIPAMTFPAVPGTPATSATKIPEVSLLSMHSRAGVVEIFATAVDAKSGALLGAIGPIWAESKIVDHRVLTAISFGDVTEPPEIRTAR